MSNSRLRRYDGTLRSSCYLLKHRLTFFWDLRKVLKYGCAGSPAGVCFSVRYSVSSVGASASGGFEFNTSQGFLNHAVVTKFVETRFTEGVYLSRPEIPPLPDLLDFFALPTANRQR